MKKIYMTGGSGYLGKAFGKVGFLPLICDVTSENYVERAIDNAKPDLVLHLAGKSDPEFCEDHLAESVGVNVRGTEHVLEACIKHEIPAIVFSTSYVWGGGWRDAFNKHAEDSPLTPAVNNYGMQKTGIEGYVAMCNTAGETESVKIIRTSYIFDRERLSKNLSCLIHGEPIDAPAFLKRSFIHLDHFVEQVRYYCDRFKAMPNILHLAGSKTVPHCAFWFEVADQFKFDRKLVKCRLVEKDGVDGEKFSAKRPHNGGLDVTLSAKLGFPQYDYIKGIERMKNES